MIDGREEQVEMKVQDERSIVGVASRGSTRVIRTWLRQACWRYCLPSGSRGRKQSILMQTGHVVAKPVGPSRTLLQRDESDAQV